MAIDFTTSYCTAVFDLQTSYINVSYSGIAGDTGRGMFIELKSGATPLIPTTETLILSANRPDGTKVYILGIKDGNRFKLDFNNSVFEVIGTVQAELKFIGVDGAKKTSNTFIITAYEGVFDASYVRSSDDFKVLQTALEEVQLIKGTFDGLDIETLATVAPAESTRVTNESGRVTAENIRKASEVTRVANDVTRPIYVHLTQIEYDALTVGQKADAKYMYVIAGEVDNYAEQLQGMIDDIEVGYAPRLGTVEKRSDQYQGDLLELLYNYSGLKNKVAVKYREPNILDIAVFHNASTAVVYSFEPDQDGWMRLKGGVKRVMTFSVLKNQKNYDSVTGVWNTNSPPMYYTTAVGATFTGSYYGTGCFFKCRRADNGGIWEIIVDGVYKKTISCWGATTSGYLEIPLFDDLPEGNHTIVGTFKGDDPDHIPSTGVGTARGYMNFSVTDAGIGYYYNSLSQANGTLILHESSRKEFAFSAKPSSYGGSNIWVPEHGVLTVMRNIVTKFYFGDRDVTDITAESVFYRWYDNVKILTEFDAYHPSASTTPMWHGRIDQTVDGKGVHINGSFKFKQNTYIGIAHPVMLAIDKANTKNNMVVDSYGKRYALDYNTNNDSDVLVGKDSFCVAHFCDVPTLPSGLSAVSEAQRDNVAVIKVWNYNRTMRVGEVDKGEVYTRLRSDGDRKTYYVSHNDHTALTGETFDFGCTYFIGDIFEAYKALPNG